MSSAGPTPEFVNRIHQGDCVAGLASLPAGSVDLVFADPPFNIGYKYDVYQDRREAEHYLDWSKEWIAGVHRVLKPDGSFWLAIGDDYAAELKVLSQQLGFHSRSWVIWYYTFGVNCTQKFTRSHTHLLYFVKDPQQFTFLADDPTNRIPSARQLVYNDTRANPKGRLPDDTWILRPQDMADRFTTDEDTWYFPRVAGTFKERAGYHGCQMPEQLLGRIIRLCSREGELVLDPFGGSAATLVAAKKLGRKFIGFELSKEYAARGVERLKEVKLGDPLDGAEEPTLSAPSTNSRVRQPKAVKTSRTVGSATQSRSVEFSPLIEKGLIEAFRRTNEGYSLDRVLADTNLNRALHDECRKIGLPGDEFSWNWNLFSIRKAGKLTTASTSRRTEMSWKDFDQFLFASEIALSQVIAERDCPSLDYLLCDPELAELFDDYAKRFAPGRTSFEYRWGALKLRKEAILAKKRLRYMRAPTQFLTTSNLTSKKWLDDVPQSPGIYVVKAESEQNKCLYVGESLELRGRLETQFASEAIKLYGRPKELKVEYRTVPASDRSLLIGYQSSLVQKHHPRLNWMAFTAA